MIVSSMNICELVKEIMLDSPMVDRKAKYLIDSLRRKALKSRDKSCCQVFDYISQRQNKWLIIINYCKGLPTFNTIVYYLHANEINAIAIGDDYKFFWFSPHFLIRYNERFLKQAHLSKLDLLKRFVSVNKVGVTEVNDTNQCIFSRFTEGIGLGDLKIIDLHFKIFHFRTYISDQMIFDDQQKSVWMASDYYIHYGRIDQKYTGIKTL